MSDKEQHVRYETPRDEVARIVLCRPESKNMQNNTMLYELNAAFDRAAQDNNVKVIILAADGKDFSFGHDLNLDQSLSGKTPVSTWGNFEAPGVEGYMAFEEEAFFGLCWRWRNIPKPTIAAVQGRAIAAGMMLAWVCDLIVASEDALFSDPVVAFGANGVEYFAHPYELGARKAKELLFTGRQISAAAAERAGMVNQVVSLDSLESTTINLAEEIAAKPAMGLRLAKLSVNQSQDQQGFYNALRSAMSIQQLAHAHNLGQYDFVGHPDGPDLVRRSLKLPPLE